MYLVTVVDFPNILECARLLVLYHLNSIHQTGDNQWVRFLFCPASLVALGVQPSPGGGRGLRVLGSTLVYTSKFSNLYYGIFQTKPEDKPKMLMKLVCVGINKKVVGMHVLGMGSDKMMQGFGVAMKMGCTKADLDSCVAIHPMASEEFVTMGVWGTSPQETGARVSPLGRAAPGEPRLG